jgi:hypothetical protein
MEIRPTPDQEALIRQAIDAGRIARPEDTSTQAMALWEERERRRAEILARVDEAEAAPREAREPSSPLRPCALAEDVKRRGRTRLEAENAGFACSPPNSGYCVSGDDVTHDNHENADSPVARGPRG